MGVEGFDAEGAGAGVEGLVREAGGTPLDVEAGGDDDEALDAGFWVGV